MLEFLWVLRMGGLVGDGEGALGGYKNKKFLQFNSFYSNKPESLIRRLFGYFTSWDDLFISVFSQVEL